MKAVKMRMARAFIASVPMGIVLVAALVVPLSVIPGTFGFDSWPSSHGVPVTARQVRLAPPKVEVVAVRPRRAVPEGRPVFVAARPRPARVAPTIVAVAPAPRRSAVAPVSAPAPKHDRQPRDPQPVHQPPPAPEPTPQPQPQPTKGDEGLLANGTAPVAREVPQREAPAPQPAPPPVQPPAPPPVERVAPPVPCHGHGHGGEAGPRGDGDSQQ
jgi:hypothetical protein